MLYGCERVWWTFGILTNARLTYLSRDKYSDFPYIKAAKDFVRDSNINYAATSTVSWVKTGLKCGFDAAPTHEELMMQILNREPLW